MANVIGTRVGVVVERHELSDTGSRNSSRKSLGSSQIEFNCYLTYICRANVQPFLPLPPFLESNPNQLGGVGSVSRSFDLSFSLRENSTFEVNYL